MSIAGHEHHDTKRGYIFAGSAYFIWGFLPLYMKALSHIPAWEVVPHRIIWSLPISAAVVWAMGQTNIVKSALVTKRVLGMTLLTAGLVSLNWGTYVWAIINDRVLEAALGYYINPLFSIFLASVLIKENLSRAQWFAIGLASLAVAILTYESGGLPWVSLILSVTWGFYAYFKRTLPVAATPGFLLEIIVLTPPSLLLLLWFDWHGKSHFLDTGWVDVMLLLGMGVFTAVPLMLYALGAKGLRLSTIAIMQYSAPTVVFLLAVFVFKEPFSDGKLLAFVLIWAALAVYTYSLIKLRYR